MQISISNSIGSNINSKVRTDPNALAFYSRVTAAGGSLTATEKAAINQLVSDLKAKGLWSLMKAIYPMVGSSAASCAQNLVSSSFTGTFAGGWTFASTGVTPNGTNAYMNTSFNTNALSSLHYSYYSRTNTFTGRDMGNEYPRAYDLILSLGGTLYQRFNTSSVTATNLNSQGFYIGTQDATNLHRVFRNATKIGLTMLNDNNYNNANVWIGAVNKDVMSSPYYGINQCAFSSIGDGLTNTQASDFYTAVQAFQTTLSRQL